MDIIDLGVKPVWKITKDEVKNKVECCLVYMHLKNGGHVLIQLKDILDRYERGIGSGKPSETWKKSGWHKSFDDDPSIPSWMSEFILTAKTNLLSSSDFSNPTDYTIKGNYLNGEAIKHIKNGLGIVIANKEQKISVLFKDGSISKLVYGK